MPFIKQRHAIQSLINTAPWQWPLWQGQPHQPPHQLGSVFAVSLLGEDWYVMRGWFCLIFLARVQTAVAAVVVTVSLYVLGPLFRGIEI